VTAFPIRVALIGLGAMGSRHLEILSSLAPQVEIVAVADTHPPFAERAAAIAPSAKAFHHPLACLDESNVDAAIVATADDAHHEIVEACLARGIYVLCEKPLTTSAEQSRQLVEAERATGRRLVQVGYMRRFDDDYRRTSDALHSGQVGAPVLISQRHRNPWAVNDFDAQKLITSSASHDIDVFRWLTREEVTEVSAAASQSDDTVVVVLRLKSASGVLGVVELGRGPGMHYDIGCDVIASRGTLTLTSPASPAAAPDSWIERFNAAYRAQDTAWIGGVAAESITGASAYDGYAANAVVAAALSALRDGNSRIVDQAPDTC
jgi:myo-inositol 2-dehydrogenase / D-chiro-inositol 1-dehydrogenase